MAQYGLRAGNWTATTLPAQIGTLYNVGVSDATRFYGYLFQNQGQQSTGMVERSDIAARDAMINYGSPNLVDRDLVYIPRVSQGDFSGGTGQLIALDASKCFDSDLDLRVPGFATLRPQWIRYTKAGLTIGGDWQVIAMLNGASQMDFWWTMGESNGNFYSVRHADTVVITAAAVIGLDTDGRDIYVGYAASLSQYTLAGNSSVSATLNGTANAWWIINQGTNGLFAYYRVGSNSLYKIDLTQAWPVAAANQPQVPTNQNANATQQSIQDIVPYQNGIAIQTIDTRGTGTDIWYHDGANMVRIVRINSYIGRGMCVCLGELYVSLASFNMINSPILARVSTGSFQIVASPGLPFPTATQSALQPVASGRYVYWPILTPSLNGIGGTTGGYVVQYDTLTGAQSHLPTFDANDMGTSTKVTSSSIRAIATIGDSVGMAFPNSTTGTLQYQNPFTTTVTYQTGGWLVSSHYDFATPGVSKRFRRIDVHHAPLKAGESIVVKAFVDQDPDLFTPSLAPNPSGATVTHSFSGGESATVGSLTTLTFGADTVGRTLFYAVQLNAGSSNLTTPRLTYVAIEVGGTWTWEFHFDCSSIRRLLNQGGPDQQGVDGKDLYYLFRNAYENGLLLTLYLVDSVDAKGATSVVSYSVAVEKIEGDNIAYSNHPGTTGQQAVRADQEWLTTVVLRQVA